MSKKFRCDLGVLFVHIVYVYSLFLAICLHLWYVGRSKHWVVCPLKWNETLDWLILGNVRQECFSVDHCFPALGSVILCHYKLMPFFSWFYVKERWTGVYIQTHTYRSSLRETLLTWSGRSEADEAWMWHSKCRTVRERHFAPLTEVQLVELMLIKLPHDTSSVIGSDMFSFFLSSLLSVADVIVSLTTVISFVLHNIACPPPSSCFPHSYIPINSSFVYLTFCLEWGVRLSCGREKKLGVLLSLQQVLLDAVLWPSSFWFDPACQRSED